MVTSTSITEREKSILAYIAGGLSNKEISEKLFISPHTVKAHIENLLLKTNLHNRVQLAVFSIKENIIDL